MSTTERQAGRDRTTGHMARYSPEIADGAIAGSRCQSCGYATAPATPRCPSCGSTTAVTGFAPRGTVWSSTVVHIASGDRKPPFGLAYVDLDEGPRVLALAGPPAPAIGSTVRLTQDGEALIAEEATDE